MARLEEFDDVQLDVEFTQAGSRSNLTSKENIAISFGKIAKWYEALVPTGGSSGQFLGFNSSGTAKWVSNPNVDEKVKATKLAQSTVEASYYPTLVAGEGTAGVSIIDSAKINHSPGTTSIVGNTRLILGNGINEGTTNNEAGLLRIYSSGTKYHTLKGAKITTDNVEHTLPTTGGTILNTGTTSFTRTLTSGTKIGSIKINGTSQDIYAPTVNDTALTLKGAGTTVTTFTANASSAKSLDIVAGSNVTVTADATNAKISIASSHPTITKSTDTTSTASPEHGGTFTVVDSITREANGHVTKINTKTVTLPADSNTDTKVTQSATTTTNYRPILFGAKNSTDVSTLADTITDQAYTSTKMFAKPDTGILYASAFSTSGYTNGTGAQLSQYGLYLKSYKSASLPAGGNYSYSRYALRVYDGKSIDNNGMLLTMDSGGLTIVGGGESAVALANLISDDQRDSNTSRTRLNVGGTLNTAFTASVEQLILSSDNNIYFLTKCNTIADRKPVVLDTDSYFYPGTTKTGSIGTSSYMWNSVYAASIYENGTSLASKYAAIGHTHTTAIAADSGTNQLTLAASTKYKLTAGGTNFIFTTPPNTNTTYTLGTSGNNVTLTPSNGSVQSITVPYAANADAVNTTVTNGSTTSTNYGIVFAVDPNTTESNKLRKTNDFRYQMKDGAANTEGFASIVLGNTKKLSEANNKSGNIYLYSSGGNWHLINTTSTASNITHTLPATSGTILNTGTTSFTQTLSSGTKIGTIKINGTSTDLYCQTNTNTDTLVSQTFATADHNRPLLMSYYDTGVQTTTAQVVHRNDALFFNPSSGVLRSPRLHLQTPDMPITINLDTLQPTAGKNVDVLSVKYKNTDGTSTHTVFPIGILGNDATGSTANYNSGVRLGSTNGTTIVGAGESSVTFAAAQAKYNDENLYFVADQAVYMYTNCSNDSTTVTGPWRVGGFTTGTSAITSGRVMITDGTTGGFKASDYTIAKSVPSDAKFSDTVTTVTTSGSGNAITSITASNGALTVTKGSTFSLSTHTHNSLYGVSSTSDVPVTTLADGQLKVFYHVNNGLTGNMPASNNANAIIQINKHPGDYDAQLGFSSNGNIYYRSCNGAVLSASVPWRKIYDTSNPPTASEVGALASTTKYAGSSSAGGAANSANVLNYNNSVTATTSGLQYTHGGITIGTADGNSKEGSDPSYKLWSYPAGGTVANSTSANIQNLRLYWSSAYFRDIFLSPNNDRIYHRAVINNSAKPWYVLLDSNNLETYSLHTPDTAKALSLDTGLNMSPITRPQNLHNRSNKLALIPGSNIAVEYSTDAGSNWTDMGLTADAKGNLFNDTIFAKIPIGPNDSTDRTTSMQTRITITCDGRDQTIDQYILRLDSSYQTISIDLQVAYGNATTTFTNIRTGLSCPPSTYQYILNTETKRFGTNTTSAYVNKIRFIIKYTNVNGSHKTSKATIDSIAGYSGIYWGGAAKNNLMIYDHLYTWDNSQNATFPAQINATGGTITNSEWKALIIKRTSTNSAGVHFENNNGYLGAIGMNTVDGTLKRWETDGLTGYEIIDRSVVSSTPSAKVNTNWNTTADRTTVVTKGWMSYWDGAYNGSTSNLTYCNRGAFGTIVTKSATDYSKVESSTNGKIKIDGTDTTVYTHPSHTSKTSGLYKITVDTLGHVSATASVAKGDIPALDYVPNTNAGVNAAINLLATGSSDPQLADYYIAQYAGGGTTTTTYHRRPISALWNTFKSLITVGTTGSGNAVTSVSIGNDGNNRKITVTKGSTFSLSTHTHNYAGSSSAGGAATNVAIARVTKDSKVFPGANKVVFEEYTNGTTYNLPSNHFYHIMSAQGSDTKYGTQLALGMTTTAAYYRSYNNQTWSAWKSIINTDTYDRNRYNASIKAGSSALVAANIIVGKDGVYKHLKSGGAFDITYPILYLNGAVDANGTTTNTYDTINFTVTTTQSITLSAYRPVYIKGTLNGTVFTPVNTTPLIQTIPTSGTNDYIYLGQATSSTTVYLQERHPIYSYRNGRVQEITPCASMAASSDGFVAPMIKKLYDNSATSTNYITISDVNIDDYEFFIICITDAPKTNWESVATQWIPAREGNHHFMINNGAGPGQGGGYIRFTDGSMYIAKTGTDNKDLRFTLCRPDEGIKSSGSSVTTDTFPNTRIMRVYGVKAF